MDEVTKETLVSSAKELFATMTIDEVNETLAEVRVEATSAKKAIRSADKAEKKKAETAKIKETIDENMAVIDTLKEGDSIVVTVGSGKNKADVECSFVKKTDKRFTVNLDGTNRSVMFQKFVGFAEEMTSDEQDEVDEEFPEDSEEVYSEDFVEEETYEAVV